MNNKFKGMYDPTKTSYITNTTNGRGYGKTQQIIEQLQQENNRLKDNWNELKKWLEEKMSVYEHQEASNFYVVLNKMQELEGNNE